MARIKPFTGIRYNQEKVEFSAVVTEPYDKIDDKLLKKYYQQSPYSTARLVKNNSADPYQEAAKTLQNWLAEKILVSDTKPMLYAYNQEYKVDGNLKVRKGFICLVGLEDYSKKIILPHERTLTKPKADRLNLMRATQSNLEQIFLLYSDKAKAVNKILEKYTSKPAQEIATDHFGDKHKLWLVNEDKDIQLISQIMTEKQLFIADGHHRYETSCAFARENGQEPGTEGKYAYRMATLVNMDDEGLTILPTHRLLHGLNFSEDKFLADAKKYFEITKLANIETLLKEMATKQDGNTFGFYAGKNFYLLNYKRSQETDSFVEQGHSQAWRKLDVAILHTIVLEKILGINKEKQAAQENITYMRYIPEALNLINNKSEQAVFFLNPTKIDQVAEVALAGDVMPQKSTDFYPKLLSGMVFYKIPS